MHGAEGVGGVEYDRHRIGAAELLHCARVTWCAEHVRGKDPGDPVHLALRVAQVELERVRVALREHGTVAVPHDGVTGRREGERGQEHRPLGAQGLDSEDQPGRAARHCDHVGNAEPLGRLLLQGADEAAVGELAALVRRPEPGCHRLERWGERSGERDAVGEGGWAAEDRWCLHAKVSG